MKRKRTWEEPSDDQLAAAEAVLKLAPNTFIAVPFKNDGDIVFEVVELHDGALAYRGSWYGENGNTRYAIGAKSAQFTFFAHEFRIRGFFTHDAHWMRMEWHINAADMARVMAMEQRRREAWS